MRLADYHVRRLTLHVTDDADTMRGALLVEDALRTASVNTGARVLVVRRLALGKIAAHVSPASVALKVEQELLEIAGHAVSVRDNSASNARAVYFDDALHVLSLLASRLAARERIDEWFWSLACPALRADLPRADALRAIVLASFDARVGALGPATVIRAIAARGDSALEEFIGALRWQDGQELFRRSGWSVPSARKEPRNATAPIPLKLAAASTRVVRAWAARLGDTDARVIWASAMLAVAEQPARAADNTLPARAAALVGDVAMYDTASLPAPDVEDERRANAMPESARGVVPEQAPQPRDHPAKAAPEAGNRTNETLRADRSKDDRAAKGAGARDTPPIEAVVPAVDVSRLHEAEAKSGAPNAQKAGAPIEHEPHAIETTADTSHDEAVSDERPEHALDYAVTAYAGVFYLLPLLRRLGAGEWLAARPHLLEQEFIARLLRHIAQRVGAPPEDPVFAALPVAAIGDDAAAGMAPLLAEWTTTLRRWCHHNAQTGLVAVVRRDGKLSTTRTHLDIHFSLRQVDLRIRKAGLDVDPGWISWFGRVVAFHYEAERWSRG